MRVLVSPASLKGVLSAQVAAAALTIGLSRAQVESIEVLPVADGGEGTLDALHAALGGTWHDVLVSDAFGRSRNARWLALPDGTAAVESAEAIPLDMERLDVLSASSRGLGELIAAIRQPEALIVGLGGTATLDGGAGLLEVLDQLPTPTRVACDVDIPLFDAARLFARQKGATTMQVDQLGQRLASMAELQPFANLAGAGAAGGLGAALASLGAELMPGAPFVLTQLGFDVAGFDLVITGEGTVDATTALGKAPGEVLRACVLGGVRCALFGGRVLERLPHAETFALSGDPRRAEKDLIELGEQLGRTLRERGRDDR